jgi:hypothetical protein
MNGLVDSGKGSVRAVMSVTVVLAAAGITAVLLAREPGSALAQAMVGGWIAALGNVIGFYFGARTANGG